MTGRTDRTGRTGGTGRTGRRPGKPDTRRQVLDAAAARFAADGYERTTVRAVAADAGVDPALVHRFFGAKEQLFVAALRLPLSPADLVAALSAGPHGDRGPRVVRTFLEVWDHPEASARLRAVLRSALTDERAARMLREFLLEALLVPLAEAVAPDRVRLRAGLVGSQLVGLATLRFVLAVEPLASAPPSALEAAVGPTVQRYLTGPLT